MKIKFDGYAFGDRDLDGLWFQADVNGDVVTNVEIHPDSDGAYWNKFNKPMFLQQAKEYAEDELKNNRDEFLEEIAVEI